MSTIMSEDTAHREGVHQILLDSAAEWPDQVALIHEDVAISYAELLERTAVTATWLREQGVAPGDRVVVIMPNVPEFAEFYYAISAIGAITVPLNPMLRQHEIEHAVNDSGAVLLAVWADIDAAAVTAARSCKIPAHSVGSGHAASLHIGVDSMNPESPDPDDTAVILYTSGTTGQPKGAELTHRNILSNSRAMITDLTYTTDDIVLGCLPLFHVFGQVCALNGAVAAGATLALLTRFDPAAALELIRRDRVTVIQGVPTMFATMIGAAADTGGGKLDTVRLCVTGGAPMPPTTAAKFAETFGCEVREGYGLSETSSVVTFNVPDRPNKPGSIGTAITDVQVIIVDENDDELAQGEVGELIVRGPAVMKGYWGRPDATREALRDGWFRTGDLGYVDAEGAFFIVDRKKDVILRGGYNVYPREVEEALLEHPAVAEASVIGFAHSSLGEEVEAFVVLASPIEEVELIAWARERIAAYKYPRRVTVVDTLPKGPTGKVLRRKLRTS